ncbi:MAG: hypothetical protein GEU99_14500 [Luteitalea sp.]|nr:hypothetical protein [Luteitalea sp.]
MQMATLAHGAHPRSSRVDLSASMQSGGARTAGTAGGHVRRVLLVIEAALAVVLLVGAGLLARSFVALVQVDAGYDRANVLTADLHVSGPAGTDADTQEQGERLSRLAASTLERLRAVPSVRAAGAGTMAPFGGAVYRVGFELPGITTPDGQPLKAEAYRAVITPGYAEALGMRLKGGRFFRDEDASSAVRPMLVNEAFARAYFSDGKPVTGRRFPGMLADDTIVEVVVSSKTCCQGSSTRRRSHTSTPHTVLRCRWGMPRLSRKPSPIRRRWRRC